ncbi:MAG: hypothetical protein WCJ35_07330 [Planctomycetota bacterium]
MTWVTPWSKSTCPFCFHRFHLGTAPLRITLSGGAKEKDNHVGRFLSIPAPDMGAVESPSRSLLGTLVRRFYVSETLDDKRRVCPNCHMFLPHAIASGQLAGSIVAIWGARNSGKSNFFAVLLHALQNRYASETGFTIFSQETFSVRQMKPISSDQLYRDRYGTQLGSGMAISQNQSAQIDRDLRIPLIYRLQFPKRPIDYLLRPLSRVKAMDLVIFDAAGEDMDDPTALDQFYRYVLGASGIIFMIDPFQFPGIRSRLSKKDLQNYPEIGVGPIDIVSNVINLFESRGGLRVGQKIDVPVAFAFSKSDGLHGHVYATSQIHRDSQHEGGFNVSDCDRLSDEVKECLHVWDGPRLVTLIRDKFKHYRFFALSALGQVPGEELRITKPQPRRIADPVLWLLWKRGFLRTVKD